MLPREAITVVEFQKTDAELVSQRNVLTEEWQRAFARLDDLDANIGYIEARLCELMREDTDPAAVVRAHRTALASSPFTQRLSTLADRIEEQVLKIESIQRRLDV